MDNHDTSRIATLLKNPKDVNNAYALMFTMPGVPSIYYGSEFALTGEKRGGSDGDDAVRPSLEITNLTEKPNALLQHIKKLTALRKSNTVLQSGAYREIIVRNEQFVFARELDDDYVLVCLNCADRAEGLNFQYNGRNYQFVVQPHASVIFPKPVMK